MRELQRLNEHWVIRAVAEHEADKQTLVDILEEVNESRMRFKVSTSPQLDLHFCREYFLALAGNWSSSIQDRESDRREA